MSFFHFLTTLHKNTGHSTGHSFRKKYTTYQQFALLYLLLLLWTVQLRMNTINCLIKYSLNSGIFHYNDVIWAQWRLESPASRIFTQPFIQAQIKENIKPPRHWSLWGEFTGHRWIPRTKGQWRGKCFHLMTSPYSWFSMYHAISQFRTSQ